MKLLQTIVTCGALAFVLGLMAETAEARHGGRLVGYTQCGQAIYAYPSLVGYDRCGTPVYQWVPRYPAARPSYHAAPVHRGHYVPASRYQERAYGGRYGSGSYGSCDTGYRGAPTRSGGSVVLRFGY